MAVLFAQLKETREKRQKAYTDVNKLVKKVQDEKRDMSAEERAQFDTITDMVLQHDSEIKKLSALVGGEEEEEGDTPTESESSNDDSGDDSERGVSNRNTEERNRTQKPKNTGRRADPNDNPSRARWTNPPEVKQRFGETAAQFATRSRRASREYSSVVFDYLRGGDRAMIMSPNARALQADVDFIGGYLVLPEQITQKILKKVDNIIWLQKKANVMKVPNAASLGMPTLDNDPADPDWTTEIATISADSSMTFGKRALTPTPIRKRILVSERFLRLAFDATFWSNDDANGAGGSPADIVINRLAYKIAATKERYFFLGNGAGQPLGIFTASSRGVSTARDVQTGSATNLTYSGLVEAKYTLKAQYQNTAEWAFNKAGVKKLMQLVDSNGRPLLDINTFPNQPTTVLGNVLNISEYVPSTFTTGLYVGALFDPNFYGIADSQEVTVTKADQLYLETGQIGFFISAESDGMPLLEEAFVRLITN